MTDLSTLRDAFTELERQADAFEPTAVRAPRRHRMAPVAAAVAAVAVLIVGAMGFMSGDMATITVAGPPTTHEELIARFRAILGDKATFEVTETGTPAELANGGQWPKGISITGMLTADGVSGSFVLEVYPDRPCGNGEECPKPVECDESQAIDDIPAREGVSGIGYICSSVSPDERVKVQMMVMSRTVPGDVYLPDPPLGPGELAELVNSDLWW